MKKRFFIVTAVETTTLKFLVFSVKETNRREAEGRVVHYIQTNFPGESYSIQTRYELPDTDTVHLLEIK